jgi:hypothetical protein
MWAKSWVGAGRLAFLFFFGRRDNRSAVTYCKRVAHPVPLGNQNKKDCISFWTAKLLSRLGLKRYYLS